MYHCRYKDREDVNIDRSSSMGNSIALLIEYIEVSSIDVDEANGLQLVDC